jgi:ABC-type Mn2+/Zn2+ transport system ATPase subunit
MVKIVVDTPTKEGLGFEDYAEALVNIILESESPFTIGILGEWGVGKTSLMQTMFEKLKAKKTESFLSGLTHGDVKEKEIWQLFLYLKH